MSSHPRRDDLFPKMVWAGGGQFYTARFVFFSHTKNLSKKQALQFVNNQYCIINLQLRTSYKNLHMKTLIFVSLRLLLVKGFQSVGS